MNRYRTPFSQLKTSAGAPPSARQGVAPAKVRPMKTVNWPTPGPASKGFAGAKRARVVKQYVTKSGLI